MPWVRTHYTEHFFKAPSARVNRIQNDQRSPLRWRVPATGRRIMAGSASNRFDAK